MRLFTLLLSCFAGRREGHGSTRNVGTTANNENKEEVHDATTSSGTGRTSTSSEQQKQHDEAEQKSSSKGANREHVEQETKFPELDLGFSSLDGEWIEMSNPRRCTYQSYRDNDYENYKTSYIGEVIALDYDKKQDANGSSSLPCSRSMPVELRGITLRQLRAVNAVVNRMCEDGTMMSTIPGKPKNPIRDPSSVTLYDINTNIIMPYTAPAKKSFVEALPSTAGSQPPRWFASHFWGEQFAHTLACIETLYEDFADNFQDDSFNRGGGMTLDSTIWICAFANNQHDLSDITQDPAESGFAKALEVAKYRTISILDEGGIVFTRVWCIEELYLTHIYSQEQKRLYGKEGQGIWAIYTAHDHENEDGEEKHAVGIIPGGTSADGGDGSYIANREAPFPMERILQSRNINIQTAQASVESDRRHILNSIAKRSDLDAEPLERHDNYEELNDAVRGAFACALPALRGSYNEGGEQWIDMLKVMSKSLNRDPMRFNFEDGHGWDDLESSDAIELIRYLPENIEGLELLYAPFGAPFYNAVSDFIDRAKNLKYLEIWHSTLNAGKNEVRETGACLAKAIGNCKTIQKLELFQTELIGSLTLPCWEKALSENTSLENILINGLNNYMVEDANEDTLDKSETIENPDDCRMRIYWDRGTFPNASMLDHEIEKLENATTATIDISDM